MAFTITELFSIGGGNITLATGLGAATGEVYVGVGERLYKRNVGENTFNQYYIASNRVVTPFFVNGQICVAERSSPNDYTGNITIKKNLTQQSSNSFGFGDIIGQVQGVTKILSGLSTSNGKLVLVLQRRINLGSGDFETTELFETDGTVLSSGNFTLNPLNSPDKGYSVNNQAYFEGTAILNNKIHLTSSYLEDINGSLENQLLHFTYDGVSFEEFYKGNENPSNNLLFGFHKVGSDNRVFSIDISSGTTGLSLYNYIGQNLQFPALIDQDPILIYDDYPVGGGANGSARSVIVSEDDEYIYLFIDRRFEESILLRYNKSDFNTARNDYNGQINGQRIELMQFNSAFEGIGIGDTFFSMQVPETPPEPSQQAPRLIYPKSNPIRFVKLQSYNATSNPKNINNTLYCDLKHNNIRRAFFAQPYLKSDVPEIQFLSNVETDGISLELLDKDGDSVKDLTVEKRVDVLGQVLQFSVTVTIDQNTGNPVMLFGGNGKIPSGLEPESGNSILIENSGDEELDGLYFITNVVLGSGADPDKIFFNYQGVISGSPSADITFFEGAGTNNIYNGIIDAQDQPNGYYKLKLTITGQGESLIFNSELLLIQDVFEEDETILIEYSNNDKFFRIDYGVTPPMKIRAWARFFYQKPGSEKTLMQDADFDDVIIRATPSNIITLNVFESPFYFHRILNLVFSHDIVKVQGIAVTNGNEYSIESLSDIYSLSNGKIELKEKDYADEYNEIDSGISGDIDETGVIGSNDGLLGY